MQENLSELSPKVKVQAHTLTHRGKNSIVRIEFT